MDTNVRLAKEHPSEVWLTRALIPSGPFSHLNVSVLVDENEELGELSDRPGYDEYSITELGDEMFVSPVLGVYYIPERE